MMLFRDRFDAARRLVACLERWRGKHAVVLAIPRGAVPMGRALADALEAELDIVLAHKIGAPGNPEFAIGAVGESGWSMIDVSAGWVGASPEWIQGQVAAEIDRMARRRRDYVGGRSPIDLGGRPVIVLDDGLATGATMVVALHDTRARAPGHLVCAVPVASPAAVRRVRPQCDELVCLHSPSDFQAVGQYYLEFGQVSDAEVRAVFAGPQRATAD